MSISLRLQLENGDGRRPWRSPAAVLTVQTDHRSVSGSRRVWWRYLHGNRRSSRQRWPRRANSWSSRWTSSTAWCCTASYLRRQTTSTPLLSEGRWKVSGLFQDIINILHNPGRKQRVMWFMVDCSAGSRYSSLKLCSSCSPNKPLKEQKYKHDLYL